MSYILGALKKAEQDRRRDQPANWDDVEEQEWQLDSVKPKGFSLLPWLVSALLTALLLLVSWLIYERISVKQQPRVTEPALADDYHSGVEAQQGKNIELNTYSADREAIEQLSRKPKINAQSDSQQTNIKQTAPSVELPTLSGLMYFQNKPKSSRVLLNGRSVGLNGVIEGYEVIEINSSSVTLEKNQQQHILKN